MTLTFLTVILSAVIVVAVVIVRSSKVTSVGSSVSDIKPYLVKQAFIESTLLGNLSHIFEYKASYVLTSLVKQDVPRARSRHGK